MLRWIFPIAVCSLFAQQEPVIRSDVQQVLVPVIVTDKKGHHVDGLRVSDFRVLEDGVQQDIQSLSSDTAASTSDVGALSKAAAPGPRRTFVICVDTLHTSPGSVARMRLALESLFEKEKPGEAQYVLVGIGRQMQVLQSATTNPLAILMKVRAPSFTAQMGGGDSAALAAQLNNLRSRMEEFCKRCACSVRANQRSCDSGLETLKQSVDSDAERWTAPTRLLFEQFKNVVEELGKVPTGRTLILVSDGFNTNPLRDFYAVVSTYLPNRPEFRVENSKDVEAALAEASNIAAQRNVIIYAIDSRGGSAPSVASEGVMDAASSGSAGGFQSVLGTAGPRGAAPMVRTTTLQAAPGQQRNPFTAPDSVDMERLASATGGVYFHGGEDMMKPFRAALGDGREYYVLAYVSKNRADDGKFRRITVETVNRTLTVRAKAGYRATGSAQ